MKIFKLSPGSNLSMPGTSNRTGKDKKDIPDWVMFQQFNSNYYSGLDISCYFNNIYMDEIIQLQFQENEMTRPNYSYADYTFRSVTHGNRIVQGTFTINFKENGYLLKLLSYIKNGEAADAKLHSILENEKIPNSKDIMDLTKQALQGNYTIEDFVNGKKTLGKDEPGAWAQYMDALDEAFWGENSEASKKLGVTSDTINANSAHFMNAPKFYTGDDGFDLIIKYGEPEDTLGSTLTTDRKLPRYGTIEKLRNVHITGFSKTLDDSGKNSLESYTFMAASVA